MSRKSARGPAVTPRSTPTSSFFEMALSRVGGKVAPQAEALPSVGGIYQCATGGAAAAMAEAANRDSAVQCLELSLIHI